MSQTPTRYRLCVVNDFRNTTSFVDYQTFGSLEVWNASIISSKHRGYQLSSDSISVFLNFKLIGQFNNYLDAINVIESIISKSPVDLSGYKEYVCLFP